MESKYWNDQWHATSFCDKDFFNTILKDNSEQSGLS